MAPRIVDPAVSWVADTLDYEPLAAMQAAVRQDGDTMLANDTMQRFRYARILIKIVSTMLAAMAIGATATALQAAIEALVGWRNAALRFFFVRSTLQAYGVHLAICCSLAAAGAVAVQFLAPRAGGGGHSLGDGIFEWQ